jgi:hypothetical protein
MKTLFTVSKFYCLVTPESAEIGEYEDQGEEFSADFDLRDALYEVKCLGGFDVGNKTDTEIHLYARDTYKDFKDGSETSYSMVISGPSRAISRLSKILKANKKL